MSLGREDGKTIVVHDADGGTVTYYPTELLKVNKCAGRGGDSRRGSKKLSELGRKGRNSCAKARERLRDLLKCNTKRDQAGSIRCEAEK